MSSQMSTRERLLLIVDDMELISKEMIENAIAPKHTKLSAVDYAQLTELLVAKDNELKKTLKLATEQAVIEERMDLLRAEVNRQDDDIYQLQKQLKEAEHILSTAIYQADQKLQSITKANKRPVPSEELIKFAHRISASNAVCAPLTWAQGDPRRPYPTDIEMRLGFLGRLSDPINGGSLLQQHTTLGDLHRQGGGGGGVGGGAGVGHTDMPPATQNQFAWHPTGEMHMSMGQGGSVPMDTRNHKQENEDVEVMSTDSSSSSSSDSQ